MCMIDGADGPCTFWRRVERTARKAHKCAECGRQIQAGEKYLYSASLFEGDFSVDKMCAHCKVAADWLTENCGGYLTCGVGEDIVGHFDEYAYLGACYLLGLGRLRVGMSHGWKFQRGAHAGELRPLPHKPPIIDEKAAARCCSSRSSGCD
jgi:hypothetical protein